MRKILTIFFIFYGVIAFAQPRIQPQIIGEDFPQWKETGVLAGINAIYTQNFQNTADPFPFEGLSVKTNSTDNGFSVGTYTDCNKGQLFKVPDHGRFAYTNDDVCNCDKQGDSLITPSVNVLSSKAYHLTFSVYFNSTSASESAQVWVNSGGTMKQLIQINSSPQWQNLTIPLKNISGPSQFYFIYSDGGLWGSGLAIDDISVCEPGQGINLKTVDVLVNQQPKAYYYKQLPKHAASLLPSNWRVTSANLGQNDVTNAVINSEVLWNDQIHSATNPFNFPANHDTTITTLTNYRAVNGKGSYGFRFFNTSDSTDLFRSDDTITINLEVTDTIYSRVGDKPAKRGFWFGPGVTYDLVSLVDVPTPDTATSISVFLHEQTKVGSTFDVIILNEFFQSGVITPVFPQINEEIKVTKEMIGRWYTFKVPQTPLKTGKYYVGIHARKGEIYIGVDDFVHENTIAYANAASSGYGASKYMPMVKLNVAARKECNLTISNTDVQPGCGLSNGSLSVSTTGGQSPYKYSWMNPASTNPMISGLAAGSYSVTVTDSLGCGLSKKIALSDLGGFSVSLNQIIHEKCFGNHLGQVDITAMGGVAPYNYTWSNGSSGNVLTGLNAGNYSVTVTDNSGSGCQEIVNYEVFGPKEPLDIDFEAFHNLCYNDTLGKVNMTIKGGKSPHTFVWANSKLTDLVNSGLEAGFYPVTITDDNGCQLIDSVEIKGSLPIIINGSVNDTGGLGSILITATGGTGSLDYAWKGPVNTDFKDPGTKDLSNLNIQGVYILSVLDSLGCKEKKSFTVGGKVSVEPLLSTTDLVSVYPIPSSSIVYVRVNTTAYTTAKLLDMQGKVYDEKKVLEGIPINFSSPGTGLYFLQLTGEKTAVKKVIFVD